MQQEIRFLLSERPDDYSFNLTVIPLARQQLISGDDGFSTVKPVDIRYKTVTYRNILPRLLSRLVLKNTQSGFGLVAHAAVDISALKWAASS